MAFSRVSVEAQHHFEFPPFPVLFVFCANLTQRQWSIWVWILLIKFYTLPPFFRVVPQPVPLFLSFISVTKATPSFKPWSMIYQWVYYSLASGAGFCVNRLCVNNPPLYRLPPFFHVSQPVSVLSGRQALQNAPLFLSSTLLTTLITRALALHHDQF